MDAESGELLETYTAHTKKITSIYLKEQSAILTTSDDGVLRVTSLCPEFDHWAIEPKEYELSCFALRSPTFNASMVELFIGTSQGKLFYYYNGLLSS